MVAGRNVLFTLTVLGALAGCSSTKLDAEVPVESRAPSSASTGAGTGSAAAKAAPSTGTGVVTFLMG